MIKVEKFNVRIVRRGDQYGLNGCKTHEKDEPLVEFYDSRYEANSWSGFGQFVSRYYVSTLLKHSDRHGLTLHGGVPQWSVSATDMARVVQYLKAECPDVQPCTLADLF